MKEINRTKIYSCGSFIPPQLVNTVDLLEEAQVERYGIDKTFVRDQVGITSVSRVSEQDNYSGMAVQASLDAINKGRINIDDIDAVVYCGIEAEYSEPATAHIVAAELGVHANICFDISNACHGFTSGLQFAEALIGSQRANLVLICTAEIGSRVSDLVVQKCINRDIGDTSVKDMIGAFTVGDGAGAMLVGASDDNHIGIQHIVSKTQSQHYDLCYYEKSHQTVSGKMDMSNISKVAINLLHVANKELVQKTKWESNEIDIALIHQVGTRPYKKILNVLGLRENQSTKTYHQYGNLASATIPVNYDLARDKLESCKKMLIISIGSGISVSGMSVSM